MAKTLWPTSAPFGFITPALQNLWWGISGATGHNHRGLDEDGSCPKIALTDSVSDYETGTIPLKITNTYLTAEVTFTARYTILAGRMVMIVIPTGAYGTINGTRSSIVIEPNEVSLPSTMINNGAGHHIPATIINNNIAETGMIIAPYTGNETFTIQRNAIANYSGVSGLYNVTSICYMRWI
jgi:hypothetical protein